MIATIIAPNSARGVENHTPVTPNTFDRTRRKPNVNTNVRKNDISAEIFPFENEVNSTDENILIPANKDPKEK